MIMVAHLSTCALNLTSLCVLVRFRQCSSDWIHSFTFNLTLSLHPIFKWKRTSCRSSARRSALDSKHFASQKPQARSKVTAAMCCTSYESYTKSSSWSNMYIIHKYAKQKKKIFGSSPPCLYVGDHSILADQLGLLGHMLRTSPYYRLAGCKCLVMQHEVLCPPWCWGSIWQFFHSIQFHSILPHLPPPLWSCSFPRSHEVTCSELNHETWVSILAHRIVVRWGPSSSLICVKN